MFEQEFYFLLFNGIQILFANIKFEITKNRDLPQLYFLMKFRDPIEMNGVSCCYQASELSYRN